MGLAESNKIHSLAATMDAQSRRIHELEQQCLRLRIDLSNLYQAFRDSHLAGLPVVDAWDWDRIQQVSGSLEMQTTSPHSGERVTLLDERTDDTRHGG